ncbi:MAG: Protease Do [Candidatus Jorgensenbacteria bacterium GW2011_GWC1_48_8]|uniref:Protease Do n=2 Tax=Candidatus Joergenseniibacteriota TaxID=1752739 RepID=A0A0G1YI47_9BACT|nr:MAG: Protease Do [Candidatus Jorgensenbacteria bacterium GW2011_GWC1_48_8]KKW14617.1 MAG: Protease Do [Candidatus Jorgensenbacteria bacterium GW2011_GWB1_50_10]
MNRRHLQIVVVSVLVLGIAGFFVTSPMARANVFEDILNFLKKPIATPEMDNAPAEEAPLYKPAIDYEEAVVAAIDKAAPSVVSIVISKDLPVIEQCPYDPFADLPPEFRQFFGGGFQFSQPCQKGTQKQEVGGGSGFIVSEDGLILTNKHVVADTKAEYTVLTNDGEKYDAKVLARDPVQDIAIIKISASGLTAAKLGDSDSIKLGQTAIVIGNALGEFRNTVSVGVISGLSRTITASGEGFGTETIQGVIQTDAAINPGNSGGPLLNLKGEVIGVNTAVVSGAENIGFAIPINQAKRDINSVKLTGSIKVPYIGVRYLIITEDIAKKQNLPVQDGALIQRIENGPGVVPNSPAEKAGLKTDDIILEIDGRKIDKDTTLGSLIGRYSIGDIITLKVLRGKDTITVKITLEERPNL